MSLKLTLINMCQCDSLTAAAGTNHTPETKASMIAQRLLDIARCGGRGLKTALLVTCKTRISLLIL